MPDWSCYGPRGSDRPHAIVSEHGARIELPRGPNEIPIDKAREVLLLRFPAAKDTDAVRYLQELASKGIRFADPVHRSVVKGLWRYRGFPHYLNAQVCRLKVPQVVVDRARDSREAIRFDQIVPALCGIYHSARKEDFVAVLNPPERARVEATLLEVKKDHDRLHCLAAAAADAIAEAYAAFGIEQPKPEVWVGSVFDESKPAVTDPVIPTPEPPPETPKTDEPSTQGSTAKPVPPKHTHPRPGGR